MADISLDDFGRQLDCIYDDEKYSVRDNGSVLRHSTAKKRPRPTDNNWTFGKPNVKTGYMEIASVRVHRIVATAYHGEPPTKEHVVDHIDTNRRNNRPENLRWLTKLENALLNPITVKRIEFICGSIEAFLENPSLLRQGTLERNFEWMRTVTPQEAKACHDRMSIWSKSNKVSSGGAMGEWLYKPMSPRDEVTDLINSKTKDAVQRNWRTPSEFPCCTQNILEASSIVEYAKNITVGSIFAQNQYSKSAVIKSATDDSQKTLWVMCEQTEGTSVKPWSLAKVTFENGLFVHESCGNFFTLEGAEKQFCLSLGNEWTGGDSIDDYS